MENWKSSIFLARSKNYKSLIIKTECSFTVTTFCVIKLLCRGHRLPASPVSLPLILSFVLLYLVASPSFLMVKKISKEKFLELFIFKFLLIRIQCMCQKKQNHKDKIHLSLSRILPLKEFSCKIIRDIFLGKMS